MQWPAAALVIVLLARRNDFLKRERKHNNAQKAKPDFSVAGPVTVGRTLCTEQACCHEKGTGTEPGRVSGKSKGIGLGASPLFAADQQSVLLWLRPSAALCFSGAR